MRKFEILGELPRCDRHMKQANAIGKMTLINVLHVGWPQAFNS